MAMVVPIRKDVPAQAQGPMQAVAPPDPNFLLMAAALMHKDGRLIKKGLNAGDAPDPQVTDLEDLQEFRADNEATQKLEQQDIANSIKMGNKRGPFIGGQGI